VRRKKCSSSTRIKKEDTLTIDTFLGMLKYKDRCFKTQEELVRKRSVLHQDTTALLLKCAQIKSK
jgi:hypothetical protein